MNSSDADHFSIHRTIFQLQSSMYKRECYAFIGMAVSYLFLLLSVAQLCLMWTNGAPVSLLYLILMSVNALVLLGMLIASAKQKWNAHKVADAALAEVPSAPAAAE